MVSKKGSKLIQDVKNFKRNLPDHGNLLKGIGNSFDAAHKAVRLRWKQDLKLNSSNLSHQNSLFVSF